MRSGRGPWLLLICLALASAVSRGETVKERAPDVNDFGVDAVAEREFLDSIEDELARLRTRLKTLPQVSLQDYVDGVGKRVAPESLKRSGKSPVFYVVEDAEPNAFALPDGTIVVHDGLLSALRSEAQLASVLGHEIAHVTNKHGYRSHAAAKRASSAGWILRSVAAVVTRGRSRFAAILASSGANVALTAAVSGHSRELEDEADRAGLAYALAAGYDPRAALQVWDILARYVKDESAGEGWLFAQHATVKARLSNLTKEIERRAPDLPAPDVLVVGEERYRRALERHEALSAFQRGDYPAAAGAFEKLLADDPADASAHLYLGNVYRAMEKGRSDRAFAEYEMALEVDPTLVAAEREIGAAHYLLGEYADAAPHFARYLAEAADAPDAPGVRDQLRTCHALAGDEPVSSHGKGKR